MWRKNGLLKNIWEQDSQLGGQGGEGDFLVTDFYITSQKKPSIKKTKRGIGGKIFARSTTNE